MMARKFASNGFLPAEFFDTFLLVKKALDQLQSIHENSSLHDRPFLLEKSLQYFLCPAEQPSVGHFPMRSIILSKISESSNR